MHTNELEALREYMILREQMGELEGRESECRCNEQDFNSCTLCQELADKSSRSRGLMNLWGDNWACRLSDMLSKATKEKP